MTHTPPDLALIGRASTGKDTVADYLVEVHGYVRLAFADPLRALAAFVDPLVEPITHLRYTDAVEEFGYRQAKDTIPDFRRFLDRLGRGVREVLGEGLWVDALARKIDDLDPETPFVVTDCRFPNEARLLSVDFDAVTLRLTRAAAPVVDAPSEVALDDYAADLTFANDGTLDDLHAYLDALVLDPDVLAAP